MGGAMSSCPLGPLRFVKGFHEALESEWPRPVWAADAPGAAGHAARPRRCMRAWSSHGASIVTRSFPNKLHEANERISRNLVKTSGYIFQNL